MDQQNKDGPVAIPALILVLSLLFGAVLCNTSVLAGGIPNETCLDCHDEVGEAFAQTSHGLYFGVRPALSEYGCESCHGDGVAHVEEGDPELIINPANHDQFGGTELCLSCHDGPHFDDWTFSSHNLANMSCADCHKIHGDHPKSLQKCAPDLCYDCHSDQRAYASMPSHHPIREGKLSCMDCHGVHGGSGRLTHESSGRELCFSCHADKEGPFVFEHAPVNEDCMICHTPHGSVANNLLKEIEPALCLNCHSMHFHATVHGYDTTFVSPVDPSRGGTMTEDSWKGAMLTKCTQCHTEIHGTDMPSQSISGGGSALTR